MKIPKEELKKLSVKFASETSKQQFRSLGELASFASLFKMGLDFCNEFYVDKSTELLKESLNFMNLVPNNKYGDNYELCSRINKFLKELE
jgi:hypothetical protein